MAKIMSFMYAGNVVQDPVQGQPIHIVAPLMNIIPLFVPTTFSFSIVFGVADFDITSEHNIHAIFQNDNIQLVNSAIKLPPVPEGADIELPDKYKGFLSIVNFQNVILEQEGVYKTRIIFDNDCIGEYEIYVAKKSS